MLQNLLYDYFQFILYLLAKWKKQIGFENLFKTLMYLII